MAITVPVENGEIVNGYDPAKEAEEAKKERSGGALGKEAFLQLLVAQMKYQDPLEPTSNTEYISQLATFSSLEEMQNMRASLESSQAANLVGKTVIMGVEINGIKNYVSGSVEQVRKEGNKIYLSIDGDWYNMDDLDTIVDDEYMEATLIGEDFEKEIAKMPDPKNLTIEHKEHLQAIIGAYNSLTAYQQKYIEKYCKDAYNKFKALVAKMNELSPPTDDKDDVGDKDDAGDKDEAGDSTEGSGGTQGTETTN